MDNIEEKTVVSENDRKKEYLRSYRQHVRRIHRINAEIAELRSMKLHPSMSRMTGCLMEVAGREISLGTLQNWMK